LEASVISHNIAGTQTSLLIPNIPFSGQMLHVTPKTSTTHFSHTHNYSNMQLHDPQYDISWLPAQEVGYTANEQFHQYVLNNQSMYNVNYCVVFPSDATTVKKLIDGV